MHEVENDNVEVSKLMKNLGQGNIDVNIISRVGAKVEGKIRNLKFSVNNFEEDTDLNKFWKNEETNLRIKGGKIVSL